MNHQRPLGFQGLKSREPMLNPVITKPIPLLNDRVSVIAWHIGWICLLVIFPLVGAMAQTTASVDTGQLAGQESCERNSNE